MSEDKKNPNQGGTDNDNQDKTFTQAELDAIIGDRLSRERAKYADYEAIKDKASKYDEMEEASKSELQKAQEKATELQAKLDSMTKQNEIRAIKEKVSSATGVPISLLSADTEEECTAQANAILSFAGNKKSNYPLVPDGGEGKAPSTSKSEILAIKDEKKRLKAIEENIELFT